MNKKLMGFIFIVLIVISTSVTVKLIDNKEIKEKENYNNIELLEGEDESFRNINFDVTSEDDHLYFIDLKYEGKDLKYRLYKDDVTITSLKSQTKIKKENNDYILKDIQIQKAEYKEKTQSFSEYKEATIIK